MNLDSVNGEASVRLSLGLGAEGQTAISMVLSTADEEQEPSQFVCGDVEAQGVDDPEVEALRVALLGALAEFVTAKGL